MSDDTAEILAHVPNSGVVQMPGRRYPISGARSAGGLSLSSMFDDLASALKGARDCGDEESYYGILTVTERMQELLLAYEEVLEKSGSKLPYSDSIVKRLVRDDFADG